MRCPTCNKTFKSFDHETIDSPSTGKYNKTYTPFSRDEIFGKRHQLTQNEQIELFNQMMSIYEMTLVIQEKREKRLMRFSKNPIQTVVNNLKESFEMWKLKRKIN
jgi:transcriptional regulator NrdR family protein